MKYEKPEVVVLGESATLIQASKSARNEANLALEQIAPGTELDD